MVFQIGIGVRRETLITTLLVEATPDNAEIVLFFNSHGEDVDCQFLSCAVILEYPRLYLFLCLQRSIYFQHFAFLNILTCDVVFGQARVQRTSFKPHSGSAPGTTFPSMYLASRFRSYHS
ncbi:hypothetical protein D6D15_02656 [Aureobasidium pullulans]|uniref:Uncharacterized protein n=1 Tax=Aureobasidium pullulans TaxID=5580 RepID=A0A4S9BI85_AURPU|nr:hypothetical protein D6D15_02656 [Aureobasidium pullulans]